MRIKAMAILLLPISLAIIGHGILENDSFSRQKSLEVASNSNLQINNAVKSIQVFLHPLLLHQLDTIYTRKNKIYWKQSS